MRAERLPKSRRGASGQVSVPPMVQRKAADLDRQVVEQLKASNHPLGAYEITRRSHETGSPLAPNQVYRVLDRLIERGEVQRIELLSAYIPANGAEMGFATCKVCRSATSFEAEELARELEQACRSQGFKALTPILEVLGVCPECNAQRAAAPPIRRTRGRPERSLPSACSPVSPIHPNQQKRV